LKVSCVGCIEMSTTKRDTTRSACLVSNVKLLTEGIPKPPITIIISTSL
jgi:hypothetical protein